VSAEEALDLPPVEAESGAATILEATQPLTLKDKLKAKVDSIGTPSQILAEHEEKEQSVVTSETDVEAEARVTEHKNDRQASLLPEYLDQISLSQSVAECSKTLNTALKDSTLTVFEVTQLQDAGKKRIIQLRGN
jgi:hypothetical protein